MATSGKLAKYCIYVGGPRSVDRHLFKASHPKCPRCSSGQINAASLHEGAAVIDPDSDASTALLGRNCDMGAEGLRAMSGSHRPRIHSFAGCCSTTAIAIMRSYACLGKYRRRCKGKSQSNKCGTDHSLTFHDLPSCVTLHHLPSSARLLKIRKAPPRLSPLLGFNLAGQIISGSKPAKMRTEVCKRTPRAAGKAWHRYRQRGEDPKSQLGRLISRESRFAIGGNIRVRVSVLEVHIVFGKSSALVSNPAGCIQVAA